MPATAMFSKFKHGPTGQNVLDNNPILQHFEIGKQTASAGPELVWRIHDAYRKSDGKVSVQSAVQFQRLHATRLTEGHAQD
jgi:SCY1-like protein 2